MAGEPQDDSRVVDAVSAGQAGRPYQGRGYASSVLQALAAAITAYVLGALSPSEPAFYAHLGWKEWHGPLAVRTAEGVIPTPDEDVMILRLPKTPPRDPDGTLVAPWREGDVW